MSPTSSALGKEAYRPATPTKKELSASPTKHAASLSSSPKKKASAHSLAAQSTRSATSQASAKDKPLPKRRHYPVKQEAAPVSGTSSAKQQPLPAPPSPARAASPQSHQAHGSKSSMSSNHTVTAQPSAQSRSSAYPLGQAHLQNLPASHEMGPVKTAQDPIPSRTAHIHYASGSSDWSSGSQALTSPTSEASQRSSTVSSYTSEDAHNLPPPVKKSVSDKVAPKTSRAQKGKSTGGVAEQTLLVTAFPDILLSILPHLSWEDVRCLRSVNSRMHQTLSEPNVVKAVLDLYLQGYGYDGEAPDEVPLTLADLDSFLIAQEFERSDYAELSRQHATKNLPKVTIRMLQSTARAWSRLAARLRSQSSVKDSPRMASLKARSIFKPGRALLARVWVPMKDTWMSDEELVECERELLRAGIWHLLKKGDCVQNLASPDFGNDGKLIFDGKVRSRHTFCILYEAELALLTVLAGPLLHLRSHRSSASLDRCSQLLTRILAWRGPIFQRRPHRLPGSYSFRCANSKLAEASPG